MAPVIDLAPSTGQYSLEKKAPLLAKRGAVAFNSTPAIGTEIHGVSLAQLTEEELKEVAAIIYERGVVFFRDQNDLDVAGQVEFGKKLAGVDHTHNGLHIHPFAQGPIPEHPEVLKIESAGKYADQFFNQPRTGRSLGSGWHGDVTFDHIPPTFSILRIEQVPENGGGDTLFFHVGKLYESLPESHKTLLAGLKAKHTGRGPFKELAKQQAALPEEQRIKQPQNVGFPLTDDEWKAIDATHPVIRTHPITGQHVVYVNPGFTSHIEGLSKQESDSLLNFLYSEFNARVEFQTRFKWAKPNSVAVWDNRLVLHSIIGDVFPQQRIGYRVTVVGAEAPFYSPGGVEN